ncbi:hypothetical protein CCACVL1_02561 [Corchorus capsularis]|uniref:Uncharacterized protein n=1 Tax=Corchorus capsularis TaxID=210143 RepID=A0A1R3K7T5_COCAP|nr:hypothetical protein CCACVL1_02561 [Corchorus capsularis]
MGSFLPNIKFEFLTVRTEKKQRRKKPLTLKKRKKLWREAAAEEK